MLASLGVCLGFLTRFLVEIASDLKKKHVKAITGITAAITLVGFYFYLQDKNLTLYVIGDVALLFIFLSPILFYAIGDFLYKTKLKNFLHFTPLHFFMLGLVSLYSYFFLGTQTAEDWHLSAVIVSVLFLGGLLLLVTPFYLLLHSHKWDTWKFKLKSLLLVIAYLALCGLVLINFSYSDVLFYEYVLLGFACIAPAMRLAVILSNFTGAPYFFDPLEYLKDMFVSEVNMQRLTICLVLTLVLCILHMFTFISYVVLVSAVFLLADYNTRLVQASH